MGLFAAGGDVGLRLIRDDLAKEPLGKSRRVEGRIAVHQPLFLFGVVGDDDPLARGPLAAAADEIQLAGVEDLAADAMHDFVIAMSVFADFIVRNHDIRPQRFQLPAEKRSHRLDLFRPLAEEEIDVRPHVPGVAESWSPGGR